MTLGKLQTLEYNMFHGVAFLDKREAAEEAETSQAEDKKKTKNITEAKYDEVRVE